MKKILIGILLASATYSYAQTINAEQIKKDNVTIRGNALHQLRADTSFLATKYYVDSIAGGSSFDTTAIYNALNLKLDSVRRIPGTDSVVEYYNNGAVRHAYIDSVSGATIAAAAWSLTGNLGTSAGTNFMGTKDYQDVQFKNNDSLNVVFRRSRQIGLRGAGYDTTRFDFSPGSFLPIFTNNAIINRYTSVAMPVSTVDSLQPHSNTVFGLYAGDSLQYGSAVSNSLFGVGAGMSITGFNWNGSDPFNRGGYENTIIGSYAGMMGDTINGNFFGGTFSGQFSGDVANSVFIGLSSGRDMYHGFSNVAIGAHCFENATFVDGTTPNNNTLVGGDVFNVFHTGGSNAAFGYRAGLAWLSGNSNTLIGALCGQNQTSGGNNTYLGYFTGNGGTSQNQSIRIGDLAGQFLNKSLTGIIGSGANCANATDDSTQTGFYQQYAATAATSWNKSNGQWGINDGTQGKGKVFYCEDNNGYGHWSAVANDTTSGDAATINSVVGRFKKDSSGPTFTLTNSYITTNTALFLSANNAAVDATATSWTYTTGAGVATITFNAAPSADFKMVFRVVN